MTIEKVTLENAAEQLKTKIRHAFVELLPDEQWKSMVEVELRAFTQPGTSTDQWGHRREPPPSAFSKICNDVFSDYIKEEIKKVLGSPDLQSKWDPNHTQLSVAIKSWLTENSASLIQSTVQALAGQVAQSIVNTIRVTP